MDIYDHAYVNSTNDGRSLVEFTYRMSANEIEDFVKLRVSNNSLFSGKRNTSMGAWRAILKHMGLLHKMTYSQASKKWENLKKRYKELKYNPDGVKVSPEVWRYFTLMDDAMEGRLEASAPILEAFTGTEDFPFRPKRLRVSMATNSPCTSTSGGPEIEVCLNGDEDEDALDALEEGHQELDPSRDPSMQAMEFGLMDSDRHVMERERQVMEREKQVMERERLVLYRERAALDREIAALDRDRASLERERAVIEREKAMMEKERAVVEKEREAVSRERLALERDRARLGRAPPGGGTDDESEDKQKDSRLVDRKEQFFNLFEKLIENF